MGHHLHSWWNGLSVCHQTPVLPRGSPRSLTVLGDKKGRSRWGTKAGRDTRAPGKVSSYRVGAGGACFPPVLVAPPPSISIMKIFHPELLYQAYDKTGVCVYVCVCVCVCMFLLSALEKLRYSRQICQQFFFLSQRESSKP